MFLPLITLFIVWLILERFVFDGRLAGLFVEGWKRKLGIKPTKRKSANKPDNSPKDVPDGYDPDALIVKKRYVVGHSGTAKDAESESVGTEDNNDSFAEQDTPSEESETAKHDLAEGGKDETEARQEYTYQMVVVSGDPEDEQEYEVSRIPVVRPESSVGEPEAAVGNESAEGGLSDLNPSREEIEALDSFDPGDYL